MLRSFTIQYRINRISERQDRKMDAAKELADNASELGSQLLAEMGNPVWWTVSRILIVAAITLTTILVLKKLMAPKSKLPPGPRPLPIIGNMHQLDGSPQQSLWDLAKIHGPIMYFKMGAVPLVIVSSAEAAQEFVKVQDKAWAGRPPSTPGKIFTSNFRNIVWSPYGPYWRHMRKICTLELFTQKRLDSFRIPRTEEFNLMVRSMYEDALENKPIKLTVKLGHLATNNITRMMLNKRFFGLDVAGQMEAHRFKELIFTLFKVSQTKCIGDFIPWLGWTSYVSGTVAYMKRVKAEIDTFLQEFLEAKKKGGAAADAEEKREDFVDVLLRQPSEDGTGHLDDTSIRGVIQDMLLAGTDTSSNTVEWCIAELIRHPDCMTKLQAEIDSVVGKDRIVSETDIANLPYLNAVVKEIFRMYPPAPLNLPHESIEPTTVWGYELPAHTWLFINQYAIHRDPKYWENPQQFDPERFIKNPDIDMRGNHFQLIPFGAGRRQCPGMPLGILFVQVGLARLAQAFSFTLPGGQDPSTLDVEEKFGVTMPRANPLSVIAKPRLARDLYI